MSSPHIGRAEWSRNGKWLAVLSFAALVGFCAVGAAFADDDDWPLRLRISRSHTATPNQWKVTAENLADYPCTKLRLDVTITGGSLLRGGGQSPASLLDDRLNFQEIAVIRPHETFTWTIDVDPSQGGSAATIRARLEYAEKHAPTSSGPASKQDCTNYSPPADAGMNVAEIAFPSGSRSTSSLLVHQVMPAEADRKTPYIYRYYVTNISSAPLQNVELQASGFHNLGVVKTDPSADEEGETLRWMLGELGQCETKIISVTGTSSDVGNASACLTATFSNRLCALTRVVEPGLQLALAAPSEAMICDEVEMVLTATNPGSGVARNVKVTDDLPEGLSTNDGKRRIDSDFGNLGPGESKKVAFKAKASKSGPYTGFASARGAGQLSADSNKTTTVFRQPTLHISCAAPEERYIGRNAAFSFEVRNTGDGQSSETTVKAAVPSGTEAVAVTKGGTIGKGEITWSLGSLAPGAAQTIGFEAKTTQAGVLQTSATVAGVCATPVKVACQTRVIGIPAILLEVIDLDDPVEVGKNTTYVITVTNQGSAPGTNIRVGCDLAPQSGFVSSAGASPSTVSDNRLTFGAIPSLAPKQKVEWRVTVMAKAEGDARLAVDMTSDQFSAPIRETESTNHYK